MASVQIGIALALVAALMANLASLLKHRGCQATAPVRIRQPLQSARELARSPWFVAGWGLAAVGWFVHIASLSLAPISLVQGILADHVGVQAVLITDAALLAIGTIALMIRRTMHSLDTEETIASLNVGPVDPEELGA